MTRRPRRRAGSRLGILARFAMYFAASMIALSVLRALGLTTSPVWFYGLLWGAVIVGVRWLLRYDESKAVATSKTKAATADYGTIAAALATLTLAPAGPAFGDAAAVTVGVAFAVTGTVIVGRWLRSQHPFTGPASVISRAIEAAWDASKRLALFTLAVTTLSAAALSYVGVPCAGLWTVGAIASIPVGQRISRAYRQGRVEADVERTLAGAMSGSAPWTPLRAAAHRAPVTSVTLDEDGNPAEVRLPLPATFTGAQENGSEAEFCGRLSEWGTYAAAFTTGGEKRRHVIIRRTTPLPERLRYDGRAANRGTRVWLGRGLGGRAHEHAPGSRGVINGETFDVYWDLRTEPHGIAVGTTGSGKSQTVQLAMLQLALSGFQLVLIDPKRVEFSQWVGRPGVLTIATDIEDQIEALETAQREMQRRYDEMVSAGVNHIDLLPAALRPPRVLVVVDEVVELLSPIKARTDEAKEINDLKGRASVAIGSILRLGRAAGVHLLLAGQRADRATLDGEFQNNLALKVLQGRSEPIERTMIGLNDVEATPGVAGRGVMRTLALPQTEVQVAYVDLQVDLDKYLPKGGTAPAPYSGEVSAEDLAVPATEDPQWDYEPLPEGFDDEESPAEAPLPTTPNAGAAGGRGGVIRSPQDDDFVNEGSESAGAEAHQRVHHGGTRIEPFERGRAMLELERLHGLPGAKQQIRDIKNQIEMDVLRRAAGQTTGPIHVDHLVFLGPPGTGKTSVARIVGSLLRDLDVLPSGHVIDCSSRSALVAGYVGQTSMKVNDAVEEAAGGVLFVDEFYSYTDDFGREAVESLMTAASNSAGDLVIVIAGYKDQMTTMMTQTNPGILSRFPQRVEFEPYSPEDLTAIALGMITAGHRSPGADVDVALAAVFAQQDLASSTWGNARSARNLVSEMKKVQDRRLSETRRATGVAPSPEDLNTVTVDDLLDAVGGLDGWSSPIEAATSPVGVI